MRGGLTAFVATPAARGSRNGNRVTALRWAKRLRELGWHVRIGEQWSGEACDVLIALHARRSHASVERHAERCPDDPRVVTLTGTDVYGDLNADAQAQASLDLATRLVVLQPLALRELPDRVKAKARTIAQSATAPPDALHLGAPGAFIVCVLGHLRDVKDPLLAAKAVGQLPESSRIQVLHLGGAPDERWRALAEATMLATPRWQWLGNRPRREALRILAGADLLVLTSVVEGGANAVTEAIACDVPVMSTRIDGSIGILGADYPGYFAVGDAQGLARGLLACETEPGFLEALQRRCQGLRALVEPAHERACWHDLLAEIVPRLQG